MHHAKNVYFIIMPGIYFSVLYQQEQATPLAQDLVDAYYGNLDFTRIKEAEVISALEFKWNEETVMATVGRDASKA